MGSIVQDTEYENGQTLIHCFSERSVLLLKTHHFLLLRRCLSRIVLSQVNVFIVEIYIFIYSRCRRSKTLMTLKTLTRWRLYRPCQRVWMLKRTKNLMSAAIWYNVWQE